MNSDFIYLLNQKLLPNERIFKLSSSLLSNDIFSITLLVNAKNYDNILTDDFKEKIYSIIIDIIPKTFEVKINYKKTITEPQFIVSSFFDYIYNTSAMLYPRIKDKELNVDIGYDLVTITLKVERDIFSFFENSGLLENLIEHLDSLFIENFEIELIPLNTIYSDVIPITQKTKSNSIKSAIKLINITLKDKIMGAITKTPRYIADIKKIENDNSTICGKIMNFNRRITKEKQDVFYTFTVTDTTDVINAKIFPKPDKRNADVLAKLELLKDGDIVCIEGPVRFDKFAKENAITSYRMAYCDIDYSSIDQSIEYRTEPDDYKIIKPKPYIELEQASLFEIDQELPTHLLQGTYVVFDLETTGLSAMDDKIIELGAVKIVDGVLNETFSTFVNPHIPLPAKIIEITGIVDSDLVNAPKVEDVIPDFYKFTRGSILVAHNAPFDKGFLSVNAKKVFFDFDNETIDTLALAKQYVKIKKYKLGILCEHFNISLEGAHRAINDAVATAKLLKKLFQLIK